MHRVRGAGKEQGFPNRTGKARALEHQLPCAACKSKLLFSHAAVARKSRPSPEGAVMPTSSQPCQQQPSPLQSPTKGDPPCGASRAGGPALVLLQPGAM